MPATKLSFAVMGSKTIGWPVVAGGVTIRTIKEYSCVVEAESDVAAIPIFEARTGVQADAVNSRTIAGQCECCSRYLFDDDEYSTDREGVRVCENCQG